MKILQAQQNIEFEECVQQTFSYTKCPYKIYCLKNYFNIFSEIFCFSVQPLDV